MSRSRHSSNSLFSTTSSRHGLAGFLPRFPRLRRHPVTVLRTVVVIVLLALPAYVLLVVNAPSSDVNDDTAGDVIFAGMDGAAAPIHLHARETVVVEPGVHSDNVQQGVLRREALQVEQGREPSTHISEKKKETQSLSTSKWTLYDGLNASYVGCYPDSIHPQQRTLKGAFTLDIRKMTVEMCLRHCTRRNFLYAGLQYYSECYCGSTLERERASNKSLCNLACSGNKTQICGGAPYLSVYKLSLDSRFPPNTGLQGPEKPAKGQEEGPIAGFADGFRSCAERPADDSAFTKHWEENAAMTVGTCLALCEKHNMPLAALFRGSQCHCGFLTHNYSLRHTVDNSECSVPCAGDASLYCGGNERYAIYQTSVEDSRCTSISMGQDKEFPLIALASFPGSGNTWVRYLVERATGIYTGSYYDDGDLFKKGFRGERSHWLKGNTIAVKTHRFDEEHISAFDGAIVIVRNPYKAIISEHNRKFGGHTGFAMEKHYTQGTEWIDFVSGKSRTWTNTALNFLQYSKKILIIHYEDLRKDPYVPVMKMVRFLGRPLDEERVLCTLSSPDGKFKRKASTRRKLSFDPYTDEMQEVLGLYIKAVAMALKMKNQTALPEEYNPHLQL